MTKDSSPLPPLGLADIKPNTPVLAGSLGTWTLTYTVGSYGIDSGGQIKVAFPLVSDWQDPQFERPDESGYTTVTTNGPAEIAVSWQPLGYIRPWTKCIVIDVFAGSLEPDNTITIVYGDRSQGSPGIRAQSYQEARFECRVAVDPTNSSDPRPIAQSPQLAIVPGPAERLVCLLPSQARIGGPVKAFLKGEDLWRNPTPPAEEVKLRWVGGGEVTIQAHTISASSAASGYVEAHSKSFSARSNPIRFVEDDARTPYWGDLHGQTKTTVGTGSEDEYFSFARDWARLDFASHQGNDFQMDDAYWAHINATTRQFNQEGRFVVFPGYEWSANSPAGGDLNVFYRSEGQPILRSSHWLVPHVPEDDLSPAHPADVFFERMKTQVAADQVLLCAHVGGRYANIRDYFDPDLFGLVELVSCWGVFEWMLWDAFDKGYIVGVMANSDGHHGRPGAEGAGLTDFGMANGLTCVLADSLTRDAVFDALQARRCYGTTGDRILLDFSADGHPMGSVIERTSGTVRLSAAVSGTGPLEALQLFRGRELIQDLRPEAFQTLQSSRRLRVSWSGSRERGRQRRAVWDGEIRLTGATLQRAETVDFDVPADGILEQTADHVRFRSRTTGDRDGIDLWLDNAAAGQVQFDSAQGHCTVELSDLTDSAPRQTVEFGGLDLQVTIERYPESPQTLHLALEHTLSVSSAARTPYFVKTTQVDGQMAWSSPIYIGGP
jgi:hypothetical protein